MPFEQYCSGDYLAHNPTWDAEDSPWKAEQVLRMLDAYGLHPRNVVEVGCGAGGVLAALRPRLPGSRIVGYEIAPDAARFWAGRRESGIDFVLGDFLESPPQRFDLLLLLDVIEHLPNPFDFLQRLHNRAEYYLFHIPLDLSALTVLRNHPLLKVRNQVGHIHYFTKDLALSLLQECDYRVESWFYTGAAWSGPRRSWKSHLAALPRRLLGALGRDVAVRALGGDTLMVLARSLK